MNIKFEKMSMEHQNTVMKIFNYYISESMAAFPETILPEQFYLMMMKRSEELSAYVLFEKDKNEVIGFCSLNPYSPFSTFKATATITYFIDKDYVGKGLGSQCLAKLEEDASKLGIHNIIAEISSRNDESITFHKKHGFEFAGKLNDIGEKLGNIFSIVYMQKKI
jgi:Sortase and related acyltransferases